MENRMLKAALKYLNDYHFSIVPVKNKKAIIPWTEFQKRLPTTEEVTKWWTENPDAGIAIVTGLISGICAFDTDDEEADRYFNSLLPENFICPVSKTPGGGKHYYMACTDSKLTVATKINGYRLDFRGNGGILTAPPTTNGNGKKYEFVKELHIRKTPIPQIPTSLVSIIINNSSSKYSLKERDKDNNTTIITAMFTEGRKDEDLFSVANALTKGGMPGENTFQVLKTIAKSWGEEDQTKWFTDKVKSAMKRQGHRDKAIIDEIREFIAVTSGSFSVTEAYKFLDLVTSRDKAAARKAFSRLAKESEIERVGVKDGVYRRISHSLADLEKVDWRHASTESLPIKWPLGIERFVKVRPKAIVVVAGDGNAGKSAFLMNTIAMNPEMKVRCFISEGGESELADRITNSETPELFDEPRVEFYFKVSEWADHIAPDAMNVFDYLDPVGDDYVYVSEWIKNIYTRLDTGIAVIGLQKKIGADYGTGGPKTAEKSRLYIAIDRGGTLRIIKGKDWVDYTRKPDGLQCKFKLWKGYHFSVPPDSGWNNPKIDDV